MQNGGILTYSAVFCYINVGKVIYYDKTGLFQLYLDFSPNLCYYNMKPVREAFFLHGLINYFFTIGEKKGAIRLCTQN